tara:strand:- start:191 stop:409 length:219 start_codon:yes stop_codon:yes gene_type:complete
VITNNWIKAQVFITANHVTNKIALLLRMYVLTIANKLPIRYRGTNIFVAGSSIVKLKIALPVTKSNVSNISQ